MKNIKQFKKILIANRGEIAIRICRAAIEEGIQAVAVYETFDEETRHVHTANEAVWIGSGPRKDYLDIDRIIWAAKKSDCQAVHPGYGFLAENPELARACEKAGLIFIGPPVQVIQDLGDKTIARRLAEEAGLKIIHGSGILPKGQDGIDSAFNFTKKYGYPVMLKAVAGGGGRGIRRANSDDELLEQLPLAEKESVASFGDGRLYLEKGLIRPRHVEVQILADNYGKIVHMGARNCSIQRRHQKLVEIAPGMIRPELEKNICEAAVGYARHTGYTNAGTIEFLVDHDDQFYFLEINTRLQVEHTVTEAITGIDIVRRQIRITQGMPLDISQNDVLCRGFAIEVRINAEDPKQNFAPEIDKVVSVYQSPGGPGIRLDGMVYQGYKIPAVYDSLLVKLTVYGFTWSDTTSRLERALKNFVIVGPKTTIPFYIKIVQEKEFLSGQFDTEYIERHPELFDYRSLEREEAKIAKLLALIHHKKYNPFTE
ncbi:MAG: acetyl-CoA carboxylase biotin carboxylase subunit [Desulfobacterales bacterium]|nr:acetyl-CoA carboxylase biotin carboxylase subunit [Desulfobacterales bacterium]